MEELIVNELRGTERYVSNAPIEGSFGATALSIVNFSGIGLQASHEEPLKLGAEGRLSFGIPGTNERVAVRARVVWSHLSKTPDARGKHPYYSGFRVEDQPELLAAVEKMVHLKLLTADEQSISRKRQIMRAKAKERAARSAVKTIQTSSSGLTADEQLMVQAARDRLQSHPDEAVKWYARAKFAPADLQARIVALHHNKEDVLAVWEYLERTIDIEKVAKVFDVKK
jgi:hypothetical protein